MKRHKKNLTRRDKELIVGNFVTWGTIVTTLTLAISLVPAGAAETNGAVGSAAGVM